MVAYEESQQRQMEESERLKAEGSKIKSIYIRFEREEVVGLRKGRRKLDAPQISRSWDNEMNIQVVLLTMIIRYDKKEN